MFVCVFGKFGEGVVSHCDHHSRYEYGHICECAQVVSVYVCVMRGSHLLLMSSKRMQTPPLLALWGWVGGLIYS